MPRTFAISRENRLAEFKTRWMQCLPLELRKTIENEGDFLIKSYKTTLLIARRNILMGNWCGYVGILKSQFGRVYGLDNVDPILDRISVHGGLTFSGRLDRDITFHCKDARCYGKWYYGFDCAHYGDLIPSRYEYFVRADRLSSHLGYQAAQYEEYLKSLGETYRTKEYVYGQCKSLADQIILLQNEINQKGNSCSSEIGIT